MPTLHKGRTIREGFEPAFNAFFDFYLSPKYIDPPLLQLEDVTFFLFLRKNLNEHDKSWKMPTIRQMMARLDISQNKVNAMMTRLDKARLVEKVSGYRMGDNGRNMPNDYILSDPLQTLNEFLAFAAQGGFEQELTPQWQEYIAPLLDDYPVSELDTPPMNHAKPVSKLDTPPVAKLDTYKQTSFKQTNGIDLIWESVLETLRQQLPATSYSSFIAPAKLVALKDGAATIAIPTPKAKDWLENRLARQLKQLLSIESKSKVISVCVEVAHPNTPT
jgi:hypothetical protein